MIGADIYIKHDSTRPAGISGARDFLLCAPPPSPHNIPTERVPNKVLGKYEDERTRTHVIRHFECVCVRVRVMRPSN